MNEKQIKNLIGKGESETLEFKEKFDKEAIESGTAFANANGGLILIGVGNNGNIKGIKISKETLKNWVNEISQATEPTVIPDIKLADIKGKIIAIISIKESLIKPVAFKGISYLRIENSNKKLPPKEIAEFYLQTTGSSWDGHPANANALDIDEEKVKWFLRKARIERRLEIDQTISLKESLKRLNLIEGGNITNAAILLFGKNTQKFFPQAETRCGRFKGTEPLEFIDMKVFSGNIINQRDDAVEFVKEHIKLHAKISGTERVEEWEYPIEAIREAITNAICHRDYEIASNVQIRIFDDRIEIWGCGPLPRPLTIDDLKKKHDSVLRNVLIGKCFFLIKFVEQWGTGTNRIIKECLKYGLPEPLFEEISRNLVVTIRKYKVTEEAVAELNDRQKKVVEFLKEHEKITITDYRNILAGVTKKTAYRDLKNIEEKGIIKHIGEKRGRYYVLA